MASIRLQQKEQDSFVIEGELGFATVLDILPESSRLFNGGSTITVDLSGVHRADSAGLALLIEWLGMAKQVDRKLKYHNIPEQILAIAKASGLDRVLED